MAGLLAETLSRHSVKLSMCSAFLSQMPGYEKYLTAAENDKSLFTEYPDISSITLPDMWRLMLMPKAHPQSQWLHKPVYTILENMHSFILQHIILHWNSSKLSCLICGALRFLYIHWGAQNNAYETCTYFWRWYHTPRLSVQCCRNQITNILPVISVSLFLSLHPHISLTHTAKD